MDRVGRAQAWEPCESMGGHERSLARTVSSLISLNEEPVKELAKDTSPRGRVQVKNACSGTGSR